MVLYIYINQFAKFFIVFKEAKQSRLNYRRGESNIRFRGGQETHTKFSIFNINRLKIWTS